MREFRGDGGREASKADPEFRVDWKGSERDNNNTNVMRTDRKDGREHRGGGEGREVTSMRRESRSVGGDISNSTRERKSDDLRVSSNAQETGELRESWGSRTFLKSSSSQVAAAIHGGEEEGEIGEFTEDGAGGGGETTTRFEETKRKRDERGESRGIGHNSNNNSAPEREERQREKSERRGGGDLLVHISFNPASQHREKEREEKAAEREKEKESVSSKQKDKAKEKEESVVKEKGGSGIKENEADSRRDKESDGYNSRRKDAADQEEKDQNATTERIEKRGVPLSMGDFEHESGAGTSAGGKNPQEDNSKVGETEVKERVAESKEQNEKGKIELVEEEKEKGKRKLRDYDRAGVDEVTNAEGEDYERDVVSSYGIMRKRMLRPRGHYGGSNTREVRPRFRKDPESYPVRAAENSTLVYRSGEGLQEELRRIRKEFEDRSGKLTAEQQSAQAAAPTIEVRIPAELATTSNRQVQGSQLWGTDVYTDDSDLVAILMHTGYYAPAASSPPQAIVELRATVRVLSPQERYTSTLRNVLRSRAWGAASGCAVSVDSCYLLKKDGSKIQLEPRLTFTPAFAPTIAPAVTERTVTTRAVSMNAYRAQRFVQEVTIQYNLCNEPWLKYSMTIVADKGLKKAQYTSARLKKNDVLYVETHFHRYELSYEDSKGSPPHVENKTTLEKGKEKAEMADKGLEKVAEKVVQVQGGTSKEAVEKAGNNHNNGPVLGDKFRWALCKWPLSLRSMRAKGVPLALEFVKVLESGLGWEEVQWSPAGVCVRGKEYPLARAHFVPMQD